MYFDALCHSLSLSLSAQLEQRPLCAGGPHDSQTERCRTHFHSLRFQSDCSHLQADVRRNDIHHRLLMVLLLNDDQLMD